MAVAKEYPLGTGLKFEHRTYGIVTSRRAKQRSLSCTVLWIRKDLVRDRIRIRTVLGQVWYRYRK
jgi:hypothetical protein